MLDAWVLTPLVLLLLTAGAGLGVRRASGGVVPVTLVPVCGLALLVLYGWLAAQVWPAAIVPGYVAIAVLGALAGWRGTPAPRPGAAAAGLLAFALFAAPIVLSGEPTLAGYIKLDDTATWLALTDRVLEAGPDTDGLAPSTYEATLAVNFANGYPWGSLVPLGAAAEIAATDVAWAFQPYLAVLGGFLALALWELAAPLAHRAGARLACAVVASQAALFVGFYLWGGVKEAAVAMLAPGACALVAAVGPAHGGPRRWIPLALVVAATVPFASPGALVWLAPAAALLAISRRWPWPSWRGIALGAFGVAALAAALLVPGRHLALDRGSFTNQDDLGNLARPLEPGQIAGIWPAGDFRFAPDDRTLVAFAIAAIATAAVAAMVVLARRRQWPVVAFSLGAAVVCLGVCALGSPWLDAKALAIASPAVLFAGLMGFGLVPAAPLRVAGLGLAAALVGWSVVAQWGGVNLAPHGQLAELEAIGARFAGEGPTLMTEYSPYGARHFLREADPEAVSELRRREIPTRTGEAVRKGAAADTDELDPRALGVYRTLVLRRSPVRSRPPAAYRPVWRGEFYEAWQRPQASAVPAARLALGSRLDPAAEPRCAAVRALAERSPRGLVAATGSSPVVVPLAGGTLTPDGAGSVAVGADVARAGEYEAWLGGSVHPSVSLTIDGKSIGEVRHELNNAGQFVRFGTVTLTPGAHRIELRFEGPDLHPGSAGRGPAIGPIVLRPTTAGESRLVRFAPGDAGRLCGREWDWVEPL